MVVSQLDCTNCNNSIRFNLDLERDGCYKVTCPSCGHIHYRVIKNGRITNERWNNSMPQFVAQAWTSSSTYSQGYYWHSSDSTSTTRWY